MVDGRGLKPVEFVQRPADRAVGDKVEGVVALVRLSLSLVDERTALGEAVVHVANELRVGQGLAAKLGREHHGELAEVAQRIAHVDVAGLASGRIRLVEQHAQQGLCAACVLDCLCREKEALRCIVVVGAVERLLTAVGSVGRVFEEEYDAVDGVELGESVGIER